MLSRCIIFVVWFGLLANAGVVGPNDGVYAQDKPPVQEKPTSPDKKPEQVKPPSQGKARAQDTQVTGENVAETAIYFSGTREGMAQVRKTGVERGRITRVVADGKIEEMTYERRVIRGENMEKDKIRVDQKMPTAEYSLISAGGQVWGVINEVNYTPRQEVTEEFLSREWYGIDSFLRYKENGSTPVLVRKDKIKGVDLWVVDLTDKVQHRSRLYISAKTARILWLEYERRPDSGGEPIKFLRKFHDYRVVQGTLVPYRTVLYREGIQIEETHVMTITFGPKVDEALFHNKDAPASATASKP